MVPLAWAQEPDPEMLKAKEFFGTAGIPGDKWVEGETMVPHVAPARHHNSSLIYYPKTENFRKMKYGSFLWGRHTTRVKHNPG